MGFPENISQGETSDAIAPMRQQSASHLWQDETEFCNDKGTTCLTKPATQSDMLPDTFCTKIIVGKRIAKKWATQFFDKAVCTNRSPESPMCLGYLVGWFTGQM